MRKLKLESGTWRYRVGSIWSDWDQMDITTLEILTPAGRLIAIPKDDVQAMAKQEGQWRDPRAITPGAIRTYIESHIDTL